jgi:glycolate oxidase
MVAPAERSLPDAMEAKDPDAEWLTIPEMIKVAREKVSVPVWDYSLGGAESEVTLRRNRTAFDEIAFRPRILRGVTGRDISTTFLGMPLKLPVMLAPVGSVGHFAREGALTCARAADRAGSVTFVGLWSNPTMEEVRANTTGPLVLQLYVRGDRSWMEILVRRAEAAGYAAICLTADSATYGRRERDLHNRYFPREDLGYPNLAGMESDTGPSGREKFQAGLTWDDFSWLRATTKLPLILKGVLSPEDAEIAVERGANAIHVSNHGGRQLDHLPSTIEVLPEIVAAVRGRAEVVVDSGFVRGTDVLKALAIGARAVLIGKLMLWALAAGGEDALVRTLELLGTEMKTAMANVGARTLAQLTPDLVRPARRPADAPWPVTPGPIPPP